MPVFTLNRFSGECLLRQASAAISVDALQILRFCFRQILLIFFDMIDTRRFAVVNLADIRAA